MAVTSFTPRALSFVSIPGYANNVDVSGDYAYVAAGSSGLQVVSVIDRNAPAIIGSYNTPGNANDVKVIGDRAYVADGTSGLEVFDVSTPNNPVLLGTADTPGEAQDVVIIGDRAYVADGRGGLQVINVGNPVAPVVIGSVSTSLEARGVDVSGNFAVVAIDKSTVYPAIGGAVVVDLSNETNPRVTASIPLSGSKDVAVRDRLAYVAANSGGLQVIDFTDPVRPFMLSSLPGTPPDGFIPRDVKLFGRYAFAAEQLYNNVVPVLDLADPGAPGAARPCQFHAARRLRGDGDRC
ncbi:MAG: hypothetical protein WKF84_23510 [Pyrinomonadaceae bacterium]